MLAQEQNLRGRDDLCSPMQKTVGCSPVQAISMALEDKHMPKSCCCGCHHMLAVSLPLTCIEQGVLPETAALQAYRELRIWRSSLKTFLMLILHVVSNSEAGLAEDYAA